MSTKDDLAQMFQYVDSFVDSKVAAVQAVIKTAIIERRERVPTRKALQQPRPLLCSDSPHAPALLTRRSDELLHELLGRQRRRDWKMQS